MGSSKLTCLVLTRSTLQNILNKKICMFPIQHVPPCDYRLMIGCSHVLLFLFLKRFDCGLYTMDYMDAWDGKKIVASSLEKVCVSILKLSYFCNSYFFSKYACSVLLSFLFFHYLSAQGSVLEYRKHAATLLLLSECNVVKLDDFVKKYDAKKT